MGFALTLAALPDRRATYKRLVRRNRVIRVLRVAVPAVGTVILCALLIQIYLSSLGGRYGVGQITVTPDAVVVESPEYAGILEDGSSYRVGPMPPAPTRTAPS